MVEHNPLLDTDFLKMLYSYRQREIFARVISLTFDERPIEQIEGRVTGGSVNVDGTSSMRRSCSLTLVAKDVNINDYYWGLNTKFKLEIGLTNPKQVKDYSYWDAVNKRDVYPYKDYPDIIWFPMGLYLFTNFSVSHTTNNYTISIQGKDKMCLLNGQVNGSFFASITFDNEEYYDMKTGITTINKLPVKYIIAEAVHEYAGEPFSNIMVNDLDDLGIELLQYRGAVPMYLIIGAKDNDNVSEVINITMDGDMKVRVGEPDGPLHALREFSEDADSQYRLDTRTQRQGYNGESYEPTLIYGSDGAGPWTVARIEYGQTCGYRTTDIIYAGDLVGAIGESLTSVLDKIVTMLGEFEYFYDLEGHFVFQKKMNFIDHTFNPIVSSEQGSDDLYADSYVENQAYTTAHSWTFDQNELITAFNNTPDILNVKNDFSIWGERTSVSGAALPVHMRYALGKKPSHYTTYEGVVWTTEDQKGIYVDGKFYGDEFTEAELFKLLNEITSSIIQETQEKIIEYEKTPNPVNLSEDWWNLLDWAEYYKLIMGTPPEDKIGAYSTGFDIFDNLNDYIPEPTIGKKYINGNNGQEITYTGNQSHFGKWEPRYEISVLDVNSDGTLGYYGHGTNCTHSYTSFLNNMENYNITSYIYKPMIPTSVVVSDIDINQIIEYVQKHHITVIIDRAHPPVDPEDEDPGQLMDSYRDYGLNIIETDFCDWRELVYQMAKDYRKHNHEDDFYIRIRENTGKDLNGEWYYPDGMTSYEPFYIDLEGFWRQLYCPPSLNYTKTNVIIEDDKLYWGIINGSSYKKGREITLNDCPRTSIVHAVAKSILNSNLYAELVANYGNTYAQNHINECYEIELIDKYLIINNKYDMDENPESNLILTFSETSIPGDYSNSGWNQNVFSSPETLNFWFDIMDNGSEIANRYGIQAIGDRAKSVNDNTVKAIYFREVPTVIFTTDIETQVRKSGYTYMQIPEEIMDAFVISSQGKCAQDVLDEYLFRHTYCTESVSITAVPIYHLEPNTRIYVSDENSKVDGEYIVSRISLPLAYNGTMNITATKAVERIY